MQPALLVDVPTAIAANGSDWVNTAPEGRVAHLGLTGQVGFVQVGDVVAYAEHLDGDPVAWIDGHWEPVVLTVA